MVTDPLGDEKEKETAEASLAASISEGGKEDDEEDDDSEWQEALANTGKVYYWNVRTRETRWEKPTSKVA